MSYNDFMVSDYESINYNMYNITQIDMDIQNDYSENFSIYIDNKPIIESPSMGDKSLPTINFDAILDRTKSVFGIMFNPKYFMPNCRELDLMDREIEVYNMV
ncbi:hypothetical protein [Megavirus chiliensis]|uniref:Uncharacterized protein n=3 Tax=Megamimivirinae TaxID=3044648 RepID=A0A2L2DNB0_MIMIV|nr:hypothetical protein MegaChil _gp0806 [Megavirus chiliensis]AEQ32385.1 hypothetical protein [Megavirus chiliensis]AVG47642.1 hypothetical protein [Acanthamoeba polyphaga mimivirus]